MRFDVTLGHRGRPTLHSTKYCGGFWREPATAHLTQPQRTCWPHTHTTVRESSSAIHNPSSTSLCATLISMLLKDGEQECQVIRFPYSPRGRSHQPRSPFLFFTYFSLARLAELINRSCATDYPKLMSRCLFRRRRPQRCKSAPQRFDYS